MKRKSSLTSSKDFPKKKQKIGKGKKSPENATITTFKSKSVHLASQLEDSKSGPTTHRNLTLQDLQKHLSHPKSSIRKDALSGLRELFIAHPDLLLPALGQIIKQVVPLFAEQDNAVRHSFYLFLKLVFQIVKLKQITPFFSLLVASLKVGLTHISSSIQTDALKVADLIISHYPSLIQEHTEELLPLYLPLITSRTQHSNPSGGRRKPSHLSSIYSSHLPVLSQLLDFVSLISNPRSFLKQEQPAPVISVTEGVVWPEGDLLSPPSDLQEYLTRSSFLLHVNPTQFGLECLRLNPGSVGSGKDHSQSFDLKNRFVQVLLELWIEVVSDSLFSAPQSPYSSELCELLCTILQLLYVFVSSTSPECLNDKFLTQFTNNLLPYFPLYQKFSTDRSSPNILMVNLHFCRLIILVGNSSPLLDTKMVTDYLSFHLPQAPSVLSSVELVKCVSFVSEILYKVFHNDFVHFSMDSVMSILCSCHKLFVSCHLLSSAKHSFFTFIKCCMEEIVSSHQKVTDSPFLTHFLNPCIASIPELLTRLPKPVDPVLAKLAIQVLRLGMMCQVDCVLSSFQFYFSQLYGQKGFLSSLPPPSQVLFIHLLGQTPSLKAPDLIFLSSLIHSQCLNIATATTLVSVVHNKLSQATSDSLVHSPGAYSSLFARHMSFLFSTLLEQPETDGDSDPKSKNFLSRACPYPYCFFLDGTINEGYSSEQLRQFNDEMRNHKDRHDTSQYLITPPLNDHYNPQETLKLSEAIVGHIISISSRMTGHQLSSLVEPLTHELLVSHCALPCDTIAGLLLLLQNMFNDGCGLGPTSPLLSILPPLLMSIFVAKETNNPSHVLIDFSCVLSAQIMAVEKDLSSKVINLVSSLGCQVSPAVFTRMCQTK